ncbi:hypothetical protein D3C71_2197710 [compost metagenome]
MSSERPLLASTYGVTWPQISAKSYRMPPKLPASGLPTMRRRLTVSSRSMPNMRSCPPKWTTASNATVCMPV